MSIFDLHVSESTPTYNDDLGALDHIKAISTASCAPDRFTDILNTKYCTAMLTEDLDILDRVQRAHFDDGSKAVTTVDSELL